MPEPVKDRCTKAHEYIFLLSKSRKYYFNHEALKEPTTTYDEKVRDRDKGKLNKTPGRDRITGLKRNNYVTRNKRSVWNINLKPYKEAHFAVFPPELPEFCILAGSKEGDIVLDPFWGSGTTGAVARKHSRKAIGIELNPEYVEISMKRFQQQHLNFGG
jgi:DNA modification methylase